MKNGLFKKTISILLALFMVAGLVQLKPVFVNAAEVYSVDNGTISSKQIQIGENKAPIQVMTLDGKVAYCANPEGFWPIDQTDKTYDESSSSVDNKVKAVMWVGYPADNAGVMQDFIQNEEKYPSDCKTYENLMGETWSDTDEELFQYATQTAIWKICDPTGDSWKTQFWDAFIGNPGDEKMDALRDYIIEKAQEVLDTII